MDTQKIVAELLESGLSQQALGKAAGCSQSTISALKSGERGKRISKALGDRLQAMHKGMTRKAGSKKARNPLTQTPGL
jgi:transcriptional regulator with XRE-family HTH domain